MTVHQTGQQSDFPRLLHESAIVPRFTCALIPGYVFYRLRIWRDGLKTTPIPGFMAMVMHTWNLALVLGLSRDTFFTATVYGSNYYVSVQIHKSSEFVDIIRELPDFIDLLLHDIQQFHLTRPHHHPLSPFLAILSMVGQQEQDCPWYAKEKALNQEFIDRNVIRVVISAIAQMNPWSVFDDNGEASFTKSLHSFRRYVQRCIWEEGGALVAEVIDANLLCEMAKSFAFLARRPPGDDIEAIWKQYRLMTN
ncbi:hypothetical protein C8J56DRAFT_902578 [Mycena floridula]|nr:hypothetical protein C8J56DRAFT_902578 [Mycena floridula]